MQPPDEMLAGLAAAGYNGGLGRLSDEELVDLPCASRRLSSWQAAVELGVVAELDGRRRACAEHPDSSRVGEQGLRNRREPGPAPRRRVRRPARPRPADPAAARNQPGAPRANAHARSPRTTPRANNPGLVGAGVQRRAGRADRLGQLDNPAGYLARHRRRTRRGRRARPARRRHQPRPSHPPHRRAGNHMVRHPHRPRPRPPGRRPRLRAGEPGQIAGRPAGLAGRVEVPLARTRRLRAPPPGPGLTSPAPPCGT